MTKSKIKRCIHERKYGGFTVMCKLLVTPKDGKNRLYKKASNRACTDMEKIMGPMKPTCKAE